MAPGEPTTTSGALPDELDLMFLLISNDPQPYAWGSRTHIAAMQGRPPSQDPEAELWFGTHPVSPSKVHGADPATLDELDELPFLAKLLAAASPLSLQVHPSIEQAERGYDDEESRGLALGDPERSFKDRSHKPEMVVALSETFEALCGFRPADLAATDLDELGDDLTPALAGLRERLVREPDLQGIVHDLLTGAAPQIVADLYAVAEGREGGQWSTVSELHDAYPADPGVAIAFLMNRVSLRRGEAMFEPAREVHAYLRGFGFEVMAASDNVLRAGLTGKHIDIPALLEVASFLPAPAPGVRRDIPLVGVNVLRPPVDEFAVVHVVAPAAAASVSAERPAILVAVRGSSTVGEHQLAQGQAAYVTPDEWPLIVTTDGELFIVADPGLSVDAG